MQRDHPRLLTQVLELLAPGGTLSFSTNFLSFEPRFSALNGMSHLAELTPRSIPEDFHRKEIHRCWRISK